MIRTAFIRASCGLPMAGKTFKAPGAGTRAHQGTFPVSINTAGDIAGTYDTTSLFRSFVRAADGKITTFEAHSQAQVTGVFSTNVAGDITGTYSEAVRFSASCARSRWHNNRFQSSGAGTGQLQGSTGGGLAF